MRRWFNTLSALLLVSLLSACGGGESVKAPDCDLDLNNLSGSWVSLKGGGTGQDVPDKFARIKFYKEDGKQKAVYTAGQLAPGNPATNKYNYEFGEITSLGDAMFSINMFPDKSNQRIERLKKDNRRADVKFEGRIFVKIDQKRCALIISDFYVSYVKGEEVMDSNPAGTRTYLRAKEDLSFVHCDEPRQVYPFASETPDWEKDQPLNPKTGIFAKEPMWFHFGEKLVEGSKEEIEAHQKKVGVRPEEGCTYDFDIYQRDLKHSGPNPTTITEEGARVEWRHEHTFEKSSADGIFFEMHRYKTCADKKRTVIGAACAVFWPEPERTAEEKAEAEAGGDDKKGK